MTAASKPEIATHTRIAPLRAPDGSARYEVYDQSGRCLASTTSVEAARAAVRLLSG